MCRVNRCFILFVRPWDQMTIRLEFVCWFLQQIKTFLDVVLLCRWVSIYSGRYGQVTQHARMGRWKSTYYTCAWSSETFWNQHLGWYRGRLFAWVLHVASSTRMDKVQNVLGSSPPEIIGGNTCRGQKENVVATWWGYTSLCRPGPCSTCQHSRQSVDRSGRTCKLACQVLGSHPIRLLFLGLHEKQSVYFSCWLGDGTYSKNPCGGHNDTEHTVHVPENTRHSTTKIPILKWG